MSHAVPTPRPIGRVRNRRAALALTAGLGLAALGAPPAAGAQEPPAGAPAPQVQEDLLPTEVPESDDPSTPDEPDAGDPGPDENPPAEEPSADEPTPTPEPSAAGADVFSSSYSDGLGEFPYRYNTNRITVVDDPRLGSARKVLRFRVYQSDSGVTSNPRAQLETPYTFDQGEDRYFGFSVNLASDFPTRLPSGGWVTFGSIAYGPPYDGASPVGLRVQNRNGEAVVRWQRNDTYNFDIPWTGPRVADVRGRWLDFVIRTKLHGDPNVGFVEMWMNRGSGWVKQSLHGRSRLYMRTYDRSNNDDTNNTRIALYYRRDIPGPLTMFHGPVRVASASSTAFGAVAPTSYR